MKAGVSTVPWAVWRRPRRAAPSVASSSKRNAGALTAVAARRAPRPCSIHGLKGAGGILWIMRAEPVVERAGAPGDLPDLVLEQEAVLRQLARRRFNPARVMGPRAVARLERGPRIAGSAPRRLGARKGDERARPARELVRRADLGPAQVPTRIGAERRRNFRQAQAAPVVAVAVGQRHPGDERRAEGGRLPVGDAGAREARPEVEPRRLQVACREPYA